MVVLRRAEGSPEPEAQAIIDQIFRYASRTPQGLNADMERIRGLHHILDAAQDALHVGVAKVNDPDSKVGYRTIEAKTGIHWQTVRKYSVAGTKYLNKEEGTP